jgi:hypothetical protein
METDPVSETFCSLEFYNTEQRTKSRNPIIPSTTVRFVALIANWYNNSLLPLIRQFFLIPNRIKEFMDLRPPALIISARI